MSSDEPREVFTLKKKNLHLIGYILLGLIILILLTSLVWGKTLRLAKANRLFNDTTEPDAAAKARRVYEDLLVELPHSPYLLHNLGLAHYRAGQGEEATDRLVSAQEELEKQLPPERRQRLIPKFCYHQGNAWFTRAETEQGNEETLTKYQKALKAFKEAVKTDPDDLDAKYNYELTLLHLDQERNQEQQEKGDNQENEKKSGNSEPNKEDHEKQDQNQDTTEDKEKNETSEAETESQTEKKETDSKMSQEEAAALLEMAESGTLFQGPILPDEPPSDKDW